MLGILQHIVQQVNEAPNLHDALVIIVHRVQPHAMLPSLPAAFKKEGANSPRRREGGYTTNAGVPKTSSSIQRFKNTSAELDHPRAFLVDREGRGGRQGQINEAGGIRGKNEQVIANMTFQVLQYEFTL